MTFRAVLLALGLASVALAATPKKGIGSAKEDDEASAAPSACPPGADLALFRAMLWAFEPAPMEIRILAVEDLGLLGDPRGLNAAAQFALDPNPLLAKAAIRAIATIRHPRAEEILSNIVRHPTIPDATKVQALEALPFQNTWSALRFVQSSARNTALPYAVLTAARRIALTLPAQPAAPPPAAVSPPGGSQ
ncbi:MAG: HEAT repeat domain-containing protein [Myxococcota bacterium]